MNLRPGSRRREMATIDLTPLIDVVFLLLIFFLLTSAIQQSNASDSREALIPIDVPDAQSGAQDIQGDPLTLTITKAGEVELQGGPKDLEGESVEAQLISLYKLDPNAQILLRGDTNASHGKVIELLDVVKSIGFKRVDLVILRGGEPK